MSYSLLRWMTLPDKRHRTEDIFQWETNPNHPIAGMDGGYAIATWLTTEDEWDVKADEISSNALIRVDDRYYTFEGGEFIEVEGTIKDFRLRGVDFQNILKPDNEGIRPIMTLDNPEMVYVTDRDDPKLHIKGFRDLRPLLESKDPKILIDSELQPVVKVKYHPSPQVILPTDDIILSLLDKVHDFTMTTNQNNSGIVKVACSVDEGNVWLVYSEELEEFKEINIEGLEEFKENGMTPDEFNSIGGKWNDIIKDDKIRFAYYLEISEITDIAEVDELEVEMDMFARWKKAKHGTDYDYEYDNEHLYVTFNKDGSYKVNYQE